jgi:hypothetical protein
LELKTTPASKRGLLTQRPQESKKLQALNTETVVSRRIGTRLNEPQETELFSRENFK